MVVSEELTGILLVIMLFIIIVAGVLYFSLDHLNNEVSFIGTYKIGEYNLYVYKVGPGMYACMQNISGEQCLIAKNTLICGGISCVQVYGIVNIPWLEELILQNY